MSRVAMVVLDICIISLMQVRCATTFEVASAFMHAALTCAYESGCCSFSSQ